MAPRQLTLDLPIETRFGREDFLVSPSNADAFETFEGWPAWPDRVLLLLGPTGAGKSHLGAIWAARATQQVAGTSGSARPGAPRLGIRCCRCCCCFERPPRALSSALTRALT
jgi:DNA replication protein DnaC